MKLQFTFLPIPEELMKNKALSFGAKFLFGIYGKANKEKVKWSARYLARRMGCEIREVRSRKAELIKNNLIIVSPRKGRVDEVSINLELVNTIQEHTPVQTDRGIQNKQEGSVQNEQGRGVQSEQGNSKEHSLNNTTKDNTKALPLQLVNYFFELKGWANKDKDFYRKKKIIYARFTRPAKELVYLCDNDLEEAKFCLKKVAEWANSRELDWTIETVLKKWHELDTLQVKEKIKKPYYNDMLIIEKYNKKYCIPNNGGDWLEFAGLEKDIIYK